MSSPPRSRLRERPRAPKWRVSGLALGLFFAAVATPGIAAAAPEASDVPAVLGQRAGNSVKELTEVARFHRFVAGDLDNPVNEDPSGDELRVATLSHWFDDPNANIDIPGSNANKAYGGLVHISQATRRIYQFYSLSNVGPGATNRVGLLVRSLDHPEKIVAAFLVPTSAGSAIDQMITISQIRGEIPYAVDEARKRIYFWLENGPALNRRVMVVDETKLPDKARGTTPDGAFTIVPLGIDVGTVEQYAGAVQDFLAGDQITVPPIPDPRWTRVTAINPLRGMTFAAGRLYISMGHPSGSGDDNQSTRYRLLQVNPTTFAIEWERVVRGCDAIFHPNSEGKDRISGWAKVLRTADAFYVPCHAAGSATVVRLPLSSVADSGGEEQVFRGSGAATGYLLDPAARRVHIRIKTKELDSILTFDTDHRAFVGQQAITSSADNAAAVVGIGIDPVTGNVFAQAPDDVELEGVAENDFGLAVIGGRETPVQPPPPARDFAGPLVAEERVKVLPTDHVLGRVFIPDATKATAQSIRAVAVPPPPPIPPPSDPDANTFDVDEQPGLSDVTLSSATSGYGLRHILVGGPIGAIPARLIDNPNFGGQVQPDFAPCHESDREFVFGRVGDASLSNSIQSASAVAFGADEGTRIDFRQPSRCADRAELGSGLQFFNEEVDRDEQRACTADGVAPWAPGIVQQVLGNAINSVERQLGKEDDQGNPAEPDDEGPAPDNACDVTKAAADDFAGREWPFEEAACTPGHPAHSQQPEGSNANPENHALTGFRASVDCSQNDLVRAAAVSEPASTEHLPAAPPPGVAGVVPKVSVGSAASIVSNRRDPERGIVARAESIVRSVTITLPSGQGVISIGGAYALAESVAQGRPGTAKTTYHRVMWGVKAEGVGGSFSQEFAASEQQLKDLAAGLNRALGDRAEARVPTADADLAAGTPRGYQAGIQLDEFDSINRQVVNGDGLKEVSVFDLTFFNESVHYGRQRQIFQFAGVLSNSQYGIFCTGGARPSNGQCVLEPVLLGTLQVELQDADGNPLPGGTFTAAGTGGGTCTTGDDGRCTITDLPPGGYTVTESAAPASYQPAPDVSVTVAPGGTATAHFVNLRSIATINVSLFDADTNDPLAGGVFLVESAGAPFAKCTTDDAGACTLEHAEGRSNDVPLGEYLVQQAVAPDGYEPVIDVVPVVLESPGQVADLAFTNGREGSDVEGAATVVPFTPASTGTSSSGRPGSILDSVADLFNWMKRNVGEALLFAASLVLFGTPFYASHRRRLLIEAENPPTLTSTH